MSRGATLSCSLVRKRCACGRQVTAAQLVRYKVCAKCFAEQQQEAAAAAAAAAEAATPTPAAGVAA